MSYETLELLVYFSSTISYIVFSLIMSYLIISIDINPDRKD